MNCLVLSMISAEMSNMFLFLFPLSKTREKYQKLSSPLICFVGSGARKNLFYLILYEFGLLFELVKNTLTEVGLDGGKGQNTWANIFIERAKLELGFQ